MDLLAFELRRRAGDETRTLMEALPEILAGGETADIGDKAAADPLSLKALPIDPPDLPATGQREIDRALRDDFLTHLPSIDTDELETIQTSLTAVEREISAQRRAVYDAYELILDAVAARYLSGPGSVDDLLTP